MIRGELWPRRWETAGKDLPCVSIRLTITVAGPEQFRYHRSVAVFDAVSIEHTLARFFGKQIGARGTFYDADAFRSGNPEELAEIIGRVADTLEDRISVVRFPAQGSGTAKAQVEGAVSWLRNLSDRVRQRDAAEREDYHWEVFGALMRAIVGLLETLESQVPRQ